MRDRRLNKKQHLEFDYLAPDTVNEMLNAMDLLKNWTAEASEEYLASGYTDPKSTS